MRTGCAPACSVASACSVPQLKKAALFFAGRAAPQHAQWLQRAQCPSSKKLRFSSLDGLRPINQSSKTVPYVQAQRSCLTALLCTAYASTMYGYVTSRHGTLSSLMVLGLNQRYMLISLPALSLVPDALAPPNGCWPITAPVGLSLM